MWTMSGWFKIAVEFIKALVGQWKGSSHPNTPVESMDTMAEEAPGADSIAVRPESHQIGITSEASPNKQEIERRREIVRQFFNDFWISAEDKPGTFAERLNRAEGHINERLAARGERWQLDAASRKQLGLPPPKIRLD
jgi:hypothetical protein